MGSSLSSASVSTRGKTGNFASEFHCQLTEIDLPNIHGSSWVLKSIFHWAWTQLLFCHKLNLFLLCSLSFLLSSFSSTHFWSPRSLDHLFSLPCFAAAFAVFLHLLLTSFPHFTKLVRHLTDLILLARLLSMTDNLARFGLQFVRVAKGTSCTKVIALFPEGQVGHAEVSQKPSKFTNIHKFYLPLWSFTETAFRAVLIQTMRCDKARSTESSLTMQHPFRPLLGEFFTFESQN